MSRRVCCDACEAKLAYCDRCGDRIVDEELAVRDVCGYAHLCTDGCLDEVRLEWILNEFLQKDYPDAFGALSELPRGSSS
jgi:hypothetical protein